MADEKITSITTVYRRSKLAQLSAGAISTIPQITQIALGDGGCGEDGEPLPMDKTESALNHEITRRDLTRIKYPAEDFDDATGAVAAVVETAADFIIVLPAADLVGQAINEAGLVDEEGNFHAIKRMYTIRKDGDAKLTFTYRDIY